MNMSLLLSETANCSNAQDETHKKITLNIGGMRHETLKSTLRKIPATRLSKLCENPLSYDAQKNEYFFDRHPEVFSQILNYYRTGKLHYPTDVCGPLFEEELRFWDLDSTQVEPCCWMTYTRHRDAEETRNILEAQKIDGYDEFDEEEQREFYAKFGVTADELQEQRYRIKLIQIQIWRLFNQPQHSRLAKVVNYITVMCIIISICTFCVGTHPLFVDDSLEHSQSGVVQNEERSTVYPGYVEEQPTTISKRYLQYIECICNAWFTFELVVRFTVSPTKSRFVREGVNIIDFLATFNFYVGLIQELLMDDEFLNRDILDLLSIIRIFRIFKLTRHHPGLKILQLTLKASAGELILLILFLIFGVVIFSAMVYFAEKIADSREVCKRSANRANPQEYDECLTTKSIIDWFWWSVVTMTTVGYGDMVPKSYSGMLVGMLCALAGVLTTSLPIPVIVSNFTIFYQHMEARKKLPKNIKRKIAPAAIPLKGKTHEKIEQVKQRGRRRAILPTEYSMGSGKPSISGGGRGGDDGGVGGGVATATVTNTSILPFLSHLENETKEMTASMEDIQSTGARSTHRCAADTDSSLPSSTVVGLSGETMLIQEGPGAVQFQPKKRRISVSELLPRFYKKDTRPNALQKSMFRSTQFIQMERAEESGTWKGLSSTEDEDPTTQLIYHQKEMPVVSEKPNKSISVNSLYSWQGSLEWESFQAKSRLLKHQLQAKNSHLSEPNHSSAIPHSSTFAPVTSGPSAKRLFMKRPGVIGSTNKYKRHSLQPFKMGDSSSSRPQSISEDDASDPLKSSSTTVLTHPGRNAALINRKDSFGFSKTDSISEREDSIDDLMSIPSELSVDNAPVRLKEPKLRSASLDVSGSAILSRGGGQKTKLNIHQFPNSHSFFSSPLDNSGLKIESKGDDHSSGDVSSISNDDLETIRSSTSSLASQFLNQDNVIKNINADFSLIVASKPSQSLSAKHSPVQSSPNSLSTTHNFVNGSPNYPSWSETGDDDNSESVRRKRDAFSKSKPAYPPMF